MNLKATILGAIGVTAVAGTLVFNTAAAEKVKENIEALRAKIVAFAENDKALVTEYNDLKAKAETRITALETKKSELETKKSQLETEITDLKNQATADASKIADLNTEITRLNTDIKELNTEITNLKNQATADASEIERLQAEVNKANDEIKEIEDLSNKAVEETKELKPTNPDTLPQLPLATVSGYFKPDSAHVYITLKENININRKSKGDISLTYYDAGGNWLWTKNKTSAGYLNDPERNKYGSGTIFDKNDYQDELVAGTTYSTTHKLSNVAKVIIKVTDNDGNSQTLTLPEEN